MVTLNNSLGLKSVLSLAALCLTLQARVALAQEAETTADNEAVEQSEPAASAPDERKGLPNVARVHHAPSAVSTAHQKFSVTCDIDHPELVKRVVLVYRTTHDPKPREVEFLRAEPGPYVATVPEAEMKPGSLSYLIELEQLDGTRRAVFASRDRYHLVQIPEVIEDARERALLARLGGKRSVFAGSFDYVDFGTSQAQTVTGSRFNVRDRYYRVEGSYTYRPLRFVTEFSIRAGVVRGNSPVPFQDGLAPGESEDERFKVGLNYGSPMVRLRVNDIVHLDLEFLTSVTEVGFSVGGGGAIHIGDPYGSKLVVGFENIQTFGSRIFSRMDITATDRIMVSPIIEVTDMPHAADFGLRLLGEITADLGHGFSVAGRGGYQSRLFVEGGPSAGATVAYAF